MVLSCLHFLFTSKCAEMLFSYLHGEDCYIFYDCYMSCRLTNYHSFILLTTHGLMVEIAHYQSKLSTNTLIYYRAADLQPVATAHTS